jgi:hypothetical protein
MSEMSALSPPLLSHDIEGSPLPEEDWLAFPERKSSQLEPPSVGPEGGFADGLGTEDIISQQKEALREPEKGIKTYQEGDC